MVSGPLRGVLWILGSLGALWVVLVLATAVGMGGGMGGMGGMMGGGMPGGMDTGGGPDGPGGMMGGGPMGGGGMVAIWGVMATQTVGTLGLAGVFVYLVVDAARGDGRPTGPE